MTPRQIVLNGSTRVAKFDLDQKRRMTSSTEDKTGKIIELPITGGQGRISGQFRECSFERKTRDKVKEKKRNIKQGAGIWDT